MPSNPRCPAAQQKLTRSVFSLPLSYLANLICLSVSKAQLCLGSLLEFPIVPVGERGNVAGMGWGGDGDGVGWRWDGGVRDGNLDGGLGIEGWGWDADGGMRDGDGRKGSQEECGRMSRSREEGCV